MVHVCLLPQPPKRPRKSPTIRFAFDGKPVRIEGSYSRERVVTLDGCVVGEVVCTYQDVASRAWDRYGFRFGGVLHRTEDTTIRGAAIALLLHATREPSAAELAGDAADAAF